MEQRYNFDIIFQKLEEAKNEYIAQQEFSYSIISEINNNIQLLKEFIIDEEEGITFTRS